MKIKVLVNYYDEQLKKDVMIGDVLDVTKDRADQIIKVGYATQVEEVVQVETAVNTNENMQTAKPVMKKKNAKR